MLLVVTCFVSLGVLVTGYDDAHCPACEDLLMREKPIECEPEPDHVIACNEGAKCYVYVFEEEGHPEMYHCDEDENGATAFSTLTNHHLKRPAERADGKYYPIAADEFEGHIAVTEGPTTATPASTSPAGNGTAEPESFDPVTEPVVGNACAAGHFVNGEGMCQPCGKHTYSIGPDAESCTPCDEGFRAAPGSKICTEKKEKPVEACGAGNFVDGEGICQKCIKHTYSIGPNAESCTPCDEGFRAETGSSECTERKPKDGAAGVFSQVLAITLVLLLLLA